MRALRDGACDGEIAVRAVVRATRRFARRQRTWFRAERGIVWRSPYAERSRIRADGEAFLGCGAPPAACPRTARALKTRGPPDRASTFCTCRARLRSRRSVVKSIA